MGWRTMAERWEDQTAEGPYCLACLSMGRMTRTATGYFCDPATPDPVTTALAARGLLAEALRHGCGDTIVIQSDKAT